MYGLVFEILEEFVLDQNDGRSLWHTIKSQANCKIPDQSFLRRSHYADEEIMNLLRAASTVLGLDMDSLLKTFGKFMIRHHYLHGYNELLRANGATLRQWLSNLNGLHDHVSKSFAGHQVNFQAPIYWCEDCDTVEASILLHYYSFRGTTLVPMTVGIVQELASFQFGVDVTLTQLALQGQDGAEFTTFRITATDPSQRWKLSPTVAMDDVIDFSQIELPDDMCPFSKQSNGGFSGSSGGDTAYSMDDDHNHDDNHQNNNPLSSEQLQSIFPFHVLVNRQFQIVQMGKSLPTILNRTEEKLLERHIGDVLTIVRPVMGSAWDWQALKKLQDQHFFLVPTTVKPTHAPIKRTKSIDQDAIFGKPIRGSFTRRRATLKKTDSNLRRKVSMAGATIKFKGSMLELGRANTNNKRRGGGHVMFILSPDARNVSELRQMGLTMDDLPLHTSQRDAVFLGEYIGQEVDMANNLDKLSKKLEVEKNLSTALLYNMLPRVIADELRSGSAVEPKHHEQVTLFFSDIVGFTTICSQVDPWAVIDLLNRLYSIMDHCAAHFKLYKVETIGDAYMCCSGLPEPDELHAENIANFAICVMECVRHVPSPVDGSPLQLRVGIHTGSCTAGVVGTLTPHYCLFGDMVNVTARHESTGTAGKIQCSSELFASLTHFSKYEEEQYVISPRGLVNMKGKGDQMTYWLEGGTKANEKAGPAAVQALYETVGKMLKKQNWKHRRYFRRSGALRGDDMDNSVLGGSRHWPSTDDTTDTTTATSDTGYTFCGPFTSIESLPAAPPSDESESVSEQSMEDGIEPDRSKRTNDDSVFASTNGLSKHIFESNMTNEELVSAVHSLLSPLLQLCLSDDEGAEQSTSDRDRRDKELMAFVDHISMTFKRQNAYHNFRRTVHVVHWANFLFEQMQEEGAGQTGGIDTDPWFRLTLAFAALLRDCKHTGISQSQLKEEENMVYEMHGGENCQARYGFRYGLDILAEKFPDLYDDLVLGFPTFLYLMKKLESPAKSFKKKSTGDETSIKDTVAAMGIALRLASMGHFAVEPDSFFKWNQAAFAELRLANMGQRGSDPTPVWNDQCVLFIEKNVLPVVKACDSLLPNVTSTTLHDTVASNLKSFESKAEDYPRRSLVDESERSTAHVSVAIDVFR
ncbi:Receptor-type guanylate cyclase gcy [Seminavis robusta]|uniref:guanylate cyclase n=1 Tax=Seminavis robusta TaxID=568900 RepID=A0A9N8H892_9STRA|nr:Receptor-type guanylate cyclase gcy [Seminavis robusta]|eukprot:Sro153_g069740.1 Receptor-type guanylate cyclase gcy (1145) ;mRNA; f:55144-59203